MGKMRERFKKFKTEEWVRLVIMTVFTAILLYFTISMIVSYCSGNTLFGKSTNSSDSFFKKNGDIIMIVFFSFLSTCLIAISIFTAFFKPVGEEKAPNKVIVNRRLVVDDNPSDTFKDKKETVTPIKPISSEKLKEIEAKLKKLEEKGNKED